MKTIRICPVCKKPTLHPAFNVSGWLGPEMFECKKCDYVGSFYIEVDPEELKEDNKSDNSQNNDNILE